MAPAEGPRPIAGGLDPDMPPAGTPVLHQPLLQTGLPPAGTPVLHQPLQQSDLPPKEFQHVDPMDPADVLRPTDGCRDPDLPPAGTPRFLRQPLPQPDGARYTDGGLDPDGPPGFTSSRAPTG